MFSELSCISYKFEKSELNQVKENNPVLPLNYELLKKVLNSIESRLFNEKKIEEIKKEEVDFDYEKLGEIVIIKILGCDFSKEEVGNYRTVTDGKYLKYRVAITEINGDNGGTLIRIERNHDHRTLIILSQTENKPKNELFLADLEEHVRESTEKLFMYYNSFSKERINDIKEKSKEIIECVGKAKSLEDIKKLQIEHHENKIAIIPITEIIESRKLNDYYSQIYEHNNATPDKFFRSFWYDIQEEKLKRLETYANFASESISQFANLQSQSLAKENQERLELVIILIDFFILLEALITIRREFPVSDIKNYVSENISADYANVLTYLVIVVGLILLLMLILGSPVVIRYSVNIATEFGKHAKQKIDAILRKFNPKASKQKPFV